MRVACERVAGALTAPRSERQAGGRPVLERPLDGPALPYRGPSPPCAPAVVCHKLRREAVDLDGEHVAFDCDCRRQGQRIRLAVEETHVVDGHLEAREGAGDAWYRRCAHDASEDGSQAPLEHRDALFGEPNTQTCRRPRGGGVDGRARHEDGPHYGREELAAQGATPRLRDGAPARNSFLNFSGRATSSSRVVNE